ncbi:MAG: DUF454 family protein [Nitrospirae bacterium]|nr:DUF454 family protein [Nitrospirota bacterium]
MDKIIIASSAPCVLFDNTSQPIESLAAMGAAIYIPFEVKHSIAGRLRVVSEALRLNRALFEAVNTKILTLSGISETSFNGYCGSMTIYYDENVINEACILKNLSTIDMKMVVDGNSYNIPEEKSQGEQIGGKAKPNRLYEAVGGVLAGAGIIGVIIPGIPGIPILLLSAYFLSKSSGPLYKILLENEYIGKYLKKTDKPALTGNLKK